MPTYSENFENKKNQVNALIKQLKEKEDKNILQAVYSVSNVYDFYDNKDRLDRVNNTFFKNVDQKELLNHFKRETFNGKGNNYYEELFQEIYNRQAKANGYEPRYIVEVAGEAATTNGFMRHGCNQLNINAGMIEKYSKVDANTNKTDAKNANTIGAHSLLTLVHETQHTFQSEGIMDFVLNKETDPRTRARDAISLARMSLSNYCYDYQKGKDEEENKKIMELIRGSYWFDSMEHDSNMAPVKYVNKAIREGLITDEVFIKAVKQRAVNDIHINKCVSEDEIPATLNTRAEKMEEIVNNYLMYFKKVMKEGKIKDEVVSVLEAYMKKDENGLSQYRKDINADFKMCLDFIDYAKTHTTPDAKTVITGPRTLNGYHFMAKKIKEVDDEPELLP